MCPKSGACLHKGRGNYYSRQFPTHTEGEEIFIVICVPINLNFSNLSGHFIHPKPGQC